MNPADRMRVELVDLTCRSRPYDSHLLPALRAAGLDARLWIAGCSDAAESARSGSGPSVIDLARRLPAGRVQRGGKALEYLANLLLLLRRVRRTNPGIVHLQWLPMLEVAPIVDMRLLRRIRHLGIGSVYTVHNVLPHGTGERHHEAFRRAYHTADALVCHTEHARRELVSEFQVPEERVWTIPHGPLMTDIPELPRSECRSEFGLDERTVQVLLFGVLRPYKGIDFLLRSWHRLVGRAPNARLVIAGSGDADYLSRIDERIRALDLEERVRTMYGFLPEDELKMLIQASDVLVYPYEQVTQSGALLAGMAAGKAIIATDLEGFRETLRDGKTGRLIEYGDETGFATALARLLDGSELRQRLGNAAREEVGERFSWSRIAGKTVECYRSVLPPT